MTKAFEALAGEIPLRLSSDPVDYTSEYVYEWEVRQSGSTMPPSPLVDIYSLTWEPAIEGGWIYQADVQWMPHARKLAQLVEPWQIAHRSRCVAMAVSAGRAYELEHRRKKMSGYDITPMPDRLSHEWWQIMLEETRARVQLEDGWIREYIKEHARSSFAPGYKWGSALTMERGELRTLLELTKENLENLQAAEATYNNIKFFTGLRARSEPIEVIKQLYTQKFSRTRIITFHPSLSTWTLFIPHKKDWYHAILSKWMDTVHARPKMYFPYEMGGEIYVKASELFLAGKPFVSRDGSSWDSVCGVRLGKYFRPIMAYFNRIPQVASGISTTSLLDTGGNIYENRDVDGEMIVLGDDMNYFGCRNIPMNAWVETAGDDTKHGTILGVHYDPKPSKPRISGFKVSGDKSTAMKPLTVDDRVHGPVAFGRKLDMRVPAIHAQMYLGDWPGGTLLDRIRKVPAGEWKSTNVMIEDMIYAAVEHEQVDAFEWARQHGISEYFT